jgi:hypothetical protein
MRITETVPNYKRQCQVVYEKQRLPESSSGRILRNEVKADAERNKGGVQMAGKVLPDNGQVGENVNFDRIRRITGYLVGTTDRFNNAKRAEEKDRVKHSLS